MTPTHDLIVIGAGSGGVAASRRAALHGARVAIVENARVGGTCVIRGCVPKKLMMYAAGHAQTFDEARGYGWQDVSARFDMATWAAAKAQETARLEGIYCQLLADSGVELIAGRARLDGPGVVRVEPLAGVAGAEASEITLRAPRVLVACGGAPSRETLPGMAQAMTSDDVLDLQTLPASLLVVGGGYIGVEFASILAGLGVAVTLAFRDVLPLRGFDEDLRTRLAQALSARGITLAGGVAPTALRRTDGGFVLDRADGSTLQSAAALNATGRRPNTVGLGLDTLGLPLDALLDERGALRVDADSRCAVPGWLDTAEPGQTFQTRGYGNNGKNGNTGSLRNTGLWAIGDVTNRINLTPVAIAEGRAFADSQFGGRHVRVDHRGVPSAVFTDPPIASVGLCEDDAVAQGPVDIYTADFRPMRTAFVGGAQRSFMKLVVDGLNDRVLGVHMIGADAPEIVQSLAVALSAGATKRDFDRTLAVHPTAAEEFVLMRSPARRRGRT